MPNAFEELVSTLDAELSSDSLLPLSKRQVLLIKSARSRYALSYYDKMLRELAREIVKLRLEKIFRGSRGELSSEEEILQEGIRKTLYGGGTCLVKVLQEISVGDRTFLPGQIISINTGTAEDLISQGKIKLVIRIGNPVNLDEVLP